MACYWDEDAQVDLVRIEARLTTVTGWIKALRMVRHDLFLQAKAHTIAGSMSEAERQMLDAYSGLSQLGSMLEEAAEAAAGKEVNQGERGNSRAG